MDIITNTVRRISCAALWAIVVALPATAEEKLLPVPAVTIYPGDLVSELSLQQKIFSVNANNLGSYVTDFSQIKNKYARRTLVAGKPIALTSIKDREAVQRGKPTHVIYQSDGLLISTMLMPLEAGAAGDIIQARNIESGAIVSVTVQPDGSLVAGGQ